jgi:nucleoside permease NupC
VAEFSVVVEVGATAVAFVTLPAVLNAQMDGLSANVTPPVKSTMSFTPIPAA